MAEQDSCVRRSQDESNTIQGEGIMTDTHCPGFESNKSLSEVKLKCPDCGKEFGIFSDEIDKVAKCPACSAKVDPKTCKVG